MLTALITDPKSAITAHGKDAVKAAIRDCNDIALLAQVQTACQRAGLPLMSVAAQKRISELTVGACPVCTRADVPVSRGVLDNHLRKAGDLDGGACAGSGKAPAAAEPVPAVTQPSEEYLAFMRDVCGDDEPEPPPPVVAGPVEQVAATAARLGWKLEVIHDLGGRSEQQDNFAVAEVDGALLVVVADGMGGHPQGAWASEVATAAFVDAAQKGGATLTSLRAALYAADAALAPHYLRAPGTTLTALLLTSDAAYLAHAGDSAAWRWDGDAWAEVTIRHGAGNHLDLCLGGRGLTQGDLSPQLEAIPAADAWLLCTDGLVPDIQRDGLWTSTPRRRMTPVAPVAGVDVLTQTLVEARAAGSTDNATGLLLTRVVVDDGAKEPVDARAEVAEEVSAWTSEDTAPSFDKAEGAEVKMRCADCGEMTPARRWRTGSPTFMLARHPDEEAPCPRVSQTLPVRAPVEGAVSEPVEASPVAEPPSLTPRQAVLLEGLLSTQERSIECRRLLDEPRWADTGEPLEDDAPLLREAIQREKAGDNRSSYVADFERKLALLEMGRRLPKKSKPAELRERPPADADTAGFTHFNFGQLRSVLVAGLRDLRVSAGEGHVDGRFLVAAPHPIITPEPDPTEGEGDVWAEVIADETDPVLREAFAARRQFGIDKYGRPLQRNNGRDHRNDCRQELCDGVVYARAGDMPNTEVALIDLLRGGEAEAEEMLLARQSLRGLMSALGTINLIDAHQRVDELRQAEKGLREILTAAGDGATATSVAREISDLADLDEDGVALREYREQVFAIERHLAAFDATRRMLSEDDTTPEQVAAVIDYAEGLASRLKQARVVETLDATIISLGGNPPEVVLVARVDTKTCQRLGKEPGLYSTVKVVVGGEA